VSLIAGFNPVVVLLLALSSGWLFATLHLSLVDLARATLEDIALSRNRVRKSRRVEHLLADTYGHSKSLAIASVLSQAVVVVASVAWVAEARGADALTWVDALIGVGISLVLVWVFCVVLPMSVAFHAGERMLYELSGLVRFVHRAAWPCRGVVRFVDEVVRRLAGVTPTAPAEQAEEEILSVVEEAQREGQFDEEAREMIEAVVEFRSLTVEQVMTPRTEIAALELTNDLGAVTRAIRDIGHSRIPVYEGSLDNVVGIFYVKDLMRWMAGEGGRSGGKSFELKSILRPAIFVPETKTVRDLLRELIRKNVHIAMVADEYGGTAGLVTIEDIIEQIVGDIRDEYELPGEDAPEVTVDLSSRSAQVDARAYTDDVNDAISPLGWAIPESDDYDTVGGFVMTTLGRIPEQGEVFRFQRATVTVLEATPTRVVRLRMEIAPPEQGDAGAGAPAEVVIPDEAKAVGSASEAERLRAGK
jgi:CBS domain containing-hemolysin-like protein